MLPYQALPPVLIRLDDTALVQRIVTLYEDQLEVSVDAMREAIAAAVLWRLATSAPSIPVVDAFRPVVVA